MQGRDPPADPIGRLRLFFALWPSAAVRDALAAAAAGLAPAPGARVVPHDDLHLTVAFVGGVGEDDLGRVRRIGATLRHAVPSIGFDRYEYWPKPEVVVALASIVPAPLQVLWDDLHARLAADGFELRVKQLRPHVTLVRHVAQPPQLPPLAPIAWAAQQLCLVSSATGADASVYTVLDTWSLLDKPDAR